MKIKKIVSRIDTIQVSTPLTNIINRDLWTDKQPFIIEKSVRENKGFIKAGLHLGRDKSRYSTDKESYCLSYFNNRLHEMYKQLGIIDISNVNIDRIDYAWDFNEKMTDINVYKLLNTFMGLYTLEVKSRKTWENVDFFTFDTNGLNCMSKNKHLCMYDKEHESEGLHPYSSRIEYRYKNLDKPIVKEKLEELVVFLGRLEHNLMALEKLRIDDLYKRYEHERSRGLVRDFTEFVSKYSSKIITVNVCKTLYGKVLEGKYKNWIRRYRDGGRTIKFVSKSDITQLINDMILSLKNYIEN